MNDWDSGNGTSDNPYSIDIRYNSHDWELVARVGDWVKFPNRGVASTNPKLSIGWGFSRSNTSITMPSIPSLTFTYSRDAGYGGEGQLIYPGDYTLYIWEISQEPTKYTKVLNTVTLHVYGLPTIEYNSNGGSPTPPTHSRNISQIGGEVAMTLNADVIPSKPGWLFGGWNVKGRVYPAGAEVMIGWNETVTAVAYWYQNSATVAYNPDNGTSMEPTTTKTAQTSGTVPVTIRTDVPLKRYWLFSHWRDGAGNTYTPGATIAVGFNSTITLTAVYSRLSVTVTLNSERGDGPKVYHPEQGETFTLPEQAEDGYVFKGWSETDGGQVRYPAGYELQIETEDIILYAVWNTEFNEEEIILADNSKVKLSAVTWYPADQRTQEIGIGTSSVYLSALGYAGVQFVPKPIVEKYPLAFGISPTDMIAPNNPDLDYANVVDPSGRLTVQFFEQAGGYARDAVRLAIIDLASMNGFILTCYLSQETDTTVYTIRLMKGETDPSPTIIDGLLGSYRNPYLFTFPMYEEGNRLLDKWRSADTGTEYNAGDTLSLSGRYITPEQTLTFIALMATKTTVLKFSMQGGRNGPDAITTVANDTVTFRIPESNPVRNGYTFRGWSASANSAPSWTAGDTITAPAGTVTILYASWAVTRHPFSTNGKKINGPYCGIRIWMEQGGSRYYFNATFYQVEGGLAVINKAENRPGSATFTLANDYEDAPRSLCAGTFAQWTDADTGEIDPEVQRAIEPGMYVELLDIDGPDSYTPLADGRITTMIPNGETVAFEIGDGLAFLAKTGTWLRRNYRDKGHTTPKHVSGTIADGKIRIPIRGEDGTPSAAYRLKTTEVELSLKKGVLPGSEVAAVIPYNKDGTVYTYLRRIIIKFKWGSYLMPFAPDLNPTLTISTQAGDKTQTLPGKNVWGTGGSQIFTLDKFIDMNGDIAIGVTPKAGWWNGVEVEWCKAWIDQEELVTTPTAEYIDDADEYDTASPQDRLRVVFEGGNLAVPDIIEQIANAIDYAKDIPTGDEIPRKKLAMFRAGGSYALTYIQKLADQEDNGRALSFTVDGASPTLRVGARYKVSDAPVMAIKYGGDQPPAGYEDRCQNIVEFSPKKTLKNRPNLVTLKATLQENNQTLVLSLEDAGSTDHRDGLTIETILADSNASTMLGAGSAAVAALKARELDQWEGEVTIAGIVRGMMSEGDSTHAGSGIPLTITDSRYGLADFRTRARQVEYNYNTCTTKVTLGNYDTTYSNGIANTNALAVEVSDLVGGIADTTLYNQQHAYITTTSSWRPSANGGTVSIISNTGARFMMDHSEILELPDGNYVAVGAVKAVAGRCLQATNAYGITHIELAGNTTETIEIPEARRPDFFLGQTLTVCVLIKRA